jgi:ZIP family zinc transporter
MSDECTDSTAPSRSIARMTGYVASGGLFALSAVAVSLSLWKLLGIVWVAYGAMILGAWLGHGTAREVESTRLVWGYGISSGAMLTSACLFLVPSAIDHHRAVGGLGVAIGLIAGFVLHTAGHQLTHRPDSLLDRAVTELTIHSLAAGVIIGALYAAMPSLGTLLGFAIVSHKAPAGFAAAQRLGHRQRSPHVVMLPAASLGLSALSVGALGLSVGPIWSASIFGFASGVFLHVAIDFMPRCEIGGEIYDLSDMDEDAHAHLDRLRYHAIASTTIGSAVVVATWSLL